MGALTTTNERNLTIAEAYAPRPVRFLELWTPGDWVLKLYGVAFGRDEPRAEAVAAAKTFAAAHLPEPAIGDGRYGVGFLIVHDGRDACWLLLDWWGNEDVLYHRLFAAQRDRPTEFAPGASGAAACVWELEVLKFERDNWVNAILRNPENPDLELGARINAEV
jgi:hypothetical protein